MISRKISDSSFQIDALDGLRGIAALIVVFSHTSNVGMYYLPFADFRGTGKSGVFLFFLLSSFLLTLPLLAQGTKIFTRAQMSHYWQRRIFRIYPLYTLYLLFALLSTHAMVTFGTGFEGYPFSLNFEAFLAHLALMLGFGVTWSIAVEFKFYVVLPFIVLAMVFARKLHVLAPYVLIAVALVASQIVSPESESDLTGIDLLPYMPIFLIGIFLAQIQFEVKNGLVLPAWVKTLAKYLGFVGLAGVFLMTPLAMELLGKDVDLTFFHREYIAHSICWGLVMFSAVNVRGVIQSFFSLNALRFFGALSFSLYLFHPIFIKLLEDLQIDTPVNAWLVLLGSTLTSYLSFRFVEAPVSRFKIGGSGKAAPVASEAKAEPRA